MKKNAISKSIFFLAMLTFFYGCQCPNSKCDSSHRATESVKINIKDDPKTLDPRKSREIISVTIAKMFFEGLTRVGKNDLPELALARSVEISPDLKKYTFSLRYSEWSNGEPLTANDFVYAWRKVLDPQFLSDNAYQLYIIKNAKGVKEGKLPAEALGIKALDPMTLEIELEKPTSYFLELLAFPICFPVSQKTDELTPNWSESPSTYVCNGPFKLKEWKHQDFIAAEKNSHYWDASHVKLNHLEMVMVAEDTELKMYQKKELDWAGSPISILPIDALPELKKSVGLQTRPLLATSFIRVNVEKSLLSNKKLRKAISMAINRKEIVDDVTQGGQIPATGLVPLSLGLQQTPYFEDGNSELARALFEEGLKEEGLSSATTPPISLTYITGERNHRIAQTIQDQLQNNCGIKIGLEPIERKVYLDRLANLDYQLAMGSWVGDYNDPINFLEVFKFKKATTNNTGWENESYVELLDQSSQTMDPDARQKILAESEKLLMEEMPIIPIYHFTMLYMQNEQLKDVLLSSLGNLDFKWAHLENAK